MFSGIGGAELALPEAEWLWCAEIEKFPSAVLATRFGHPNLGDITAPDFIDRARAFGPLDLLCGGPPCQAFSVAGLRKGMADPRGQLSLRFIEIAHELASTNGLRNLLVENVPGWLSHEDNAFGCFLGGLVGADDALPNPTGGSWPRAGMVAGPRARAAWRVLDAQYAGLAQRRQRVLLVADLGNGADPAAVLFERKSLSGNTPPRRETGEGTSHDLAPSLTSSGRGIERTGETRGQDPVVAVPIGFGGGNTSGPIDVAACLTAKGQRVDFEVETFIADITGTLPAGGNSTGGDRQPGTSADTADTMLIAHTLRAMGHSTSHANAGEQMAVPIQAGALRENPESGPDGAGFREDVAYTLEARAEVQAVAFDLRGREGGAQFEGPHDTANIRAASGGSSRSYVAEQWAVRRLTVTECCRLQGYPDDWTLIEHGARRTVEDDEAKYLIAKGAHVVRDNAGRLRTNAAADGPQYKALGNAWAVACVRPIALEILKGLAA
jgi:DNA (cytosine-5)-methyltransferase 1